MGGNERVGLFIKTMNITPFLLRKGNLASPTYYFSFPSDFPFYILCLHGLSLYLNSSRLKKP